MSYITVDIDLCEIFDDIGDDELVKELTSRGYNCSKAADENYGFERKEFELLLEIIDSLPYNWELARLRDKIFISRNEMMNK